MQTMKRSLSLFMVLAMLVALVPALSLGASAANVNYVYASNGKYIYNWGTRGTTATFLSPNAEDFYEDNNTSYSELSSLSGGTGKSDAPKSELYRELQELMKSNHSYTNSYDANNDLLKYTDCQNGGGKMSSFYSGKAIGPDWVSGGTAWNKEHTWPKSKGLGGRDQDDIMMIRPTSPSENSSRGNTAYGQSSGYYNPNSESGGKYDLRGDVARIFLYIYVRWGNTSYAWGTSGVMESVEVLLEWMEADPVDTWELGRNDSVESITGTRNVFVDYPEFAFILFGEEIPANMTTPSGEAGNQCNHNNFGTTVVAATCTEKGYTLYVCQVAGCGHSYKDNIVAAKGHTYVSDVCSACGETKPVEPAKPTYITTPEVGKAYKLGLFSTTEYYFTGSIVNQYYGASDTDYAKGVDVYLEQANGGYYLYFKNSSGQKQYINIVASNDYRNFSYSSTATSVFVWDTAKNTLKTTVAGGYCYIGNYGSYSSMNGLKESNLKDTDYIARLYTMSGESSSNPSDTPSTPPAETTPEETTPNAPNTPDTPAGESVTAGKTIANLITEYGWTGTTTKQEFKLDANVTVKINGGDNSGKPYNNNHIRIYATDTPAGTMTISLADGYELVSIKISAQTGTYAYLCLNGTTTDICNKSIAVSGSSVVLNTVKNGSDGKHVRVTAIEVVYSSLATSPDIPEETTPEPEVTTPEPEVTTPEPEVTTPEPEVTTPEPEVTTPEPEVTTPEPEVTTPEPEIDYGTLNTPVTVTYAYNACANLASGETSAQAFYVKGTVTKIGATKTGTTGLYYQNVYFTDGTTEMLIYTINMPEGIDGFEVGDTIVACGYIKNYSGTIEMATYNGSVYVYVVSVETGTPDQGDVTTPEETTPNEPTPDEPTPEETTPEETTPEVTVPEESAPTEPETPNDGNTTEKKEHTCKEVNGFQKFINSIINFFRRLFGQPEICTCGEIINKED